ncbi:MAG TPA: SURF1 family protein, partial [Gammaproteobacteria bacterium]|nr:SURF1 family protein [Gammaproteobacteria bacterium]
FLLDNMVHDGVAGFYVLTPFRADAGGWVLVNRGWLPAGPSRADLPNVALDVAPPTLRGRIERLPRPGIDLGGGGGEPGTAPVEIVEFPTAAELGTRLGHGVRDYQLLLDPDEPAGYVREWIAPGLSPARHVVYAGQWLLLAAGAAGAAVVIAVRARVGSKHAT